MIDDHEVKYEGRQQRNGEDGKVKPFGAATFTNSTQFRMLNNTMKNPNFLQEKLEHVLQV